MKTLAKHVLARCGLDVRLTRNIRNHELISWEKKQDAMWLPFLRHRNISTVIDVGANEGQFAAMIHRQIPNAKVISFEPLPPCHSKLKEVLSRIPGSKLLPVAVGNKSDQVQMHCSEYTPCSSLLPGTDQLESAHPGAGSVRPIDVSVVRIDDALENTQLDTEVLMKLDVQGFEIPAVEGALETLKKTALIVVEVCFFRRLYQGQPLFHEIYDTFHGLGFQFMGFPEQYPRESDGRIVEADAIFERPLH